MRLHEFALIENINPLERRLIAEADKLILRYQQKLLFEAAVGTAIADWFKKAATFISGGAKSLSKKFIDRFWKMVDIVLEKVSLDKKSFIEKNINNLSQSLIKTIQIGIDKDALEQVVKSTLDECLKEGLIDKQNIKQSFEDNKSKIFAKIKKNLSKHLNSLKKEVESDLKAFKPVSEDSMIQRVINSSKSFAAGASFMTVFGMIDNLGLFVGMAAVEEWVISKGFDSMVAAGIGNTFSDAIGVVAGGAVAAILAKLLNVRGEGTFAQNLIGVIAGCMIPVVSWIIWISIMS